MRDLMTALQARAGNTQRQRSVEARVQIVTGRLLIPTAGDAFADISFPVSFIHVPVVAFGYELDTNAAYDQGRHPLISSVVGTWLLDERMGGMSRLYRGGRILVAYVGDADQPMWVHWIAMGLALHNPADAEQTADSTI